MENLNTYQNDLSHFTNEAEQALSDHFMLLNELPEEHIKYVKGRTLDIMNNVKQLKNITNTMLNGLDNNIAATGK